MTSVTADVHVETDHGAVHDESAWTERTPGGETRGNAAGDPLRRRGAAVAKATATTKFADVVDISQYNSDAAQMIAFGASRAAAAEPWRLARGVRCA